MPWACRDTYGQNRDSRTMSQTEICPICGSRDFSYKEILWKELISDWQLSSHEVEYINRQQGLYCTECDNNLRSMALANAILSLYGQAGTLESFVRSNAAKDLRVLEINEAGSMSSILERIPHHQLACYPEHDMTNLLFKSSSFDLILHSDTLEHLQYPTSGLSECRRVLAPTGHCVFTVPVIVGRLTRSRNGLKNSYHGNSGQKEDDLLVHWEFGADVWMSVIEAGFSSARIHCLEYPAAIAIEASNARC